MLQVECVLDWSVYMRGQTVWGSLNCDIKPWLEAHAHTPTEQKKKQLLLSRTSYGLYGLFLSKEEWKKEEEKYKCRFHGFMERTEPVVKWPQKYAKQMSEIRRMTQNHNNETQRLQRHAKWIQSKQTTKTSNHNKETKKEQHPKMTGNDQEEKRKEPQRQNWQRGHL